MTGHITLKWLSCTVFGGQVENHIKGALWLKLRVMTAPIQLTNEQFQQLLQQAAGGGNVGGEGVGTRGDSSSSKTARAVRPSVDVETTEGEWDVFVDNWGRFKRMTKLTVIEEVRDHLRQCCAPPLNKRLFDVKGANALNSATEDNLLAWMKEIAVKGVHKEVHRTQFVHLRQKQGESINSYYGRLKGESGLCDYRIPTPLTCANDQCTCANHGIEVSFQDEMVSTQLVAGLYNSDHKVRVLSESGDLPTLSAKFNRLSVLEKSDASLSSLSGGDAFSNFASSTRGRNNNWQRRKPGGVPQDSQRNKGNVGGKGKEVGGSLCPECKVKHPQCTVCNGFHKCTTQCNNCKKLGHIRNCCPNNISRVSNASVDTEVANRVHDEESEVLFGFAFHLSLDAISEETVDRSQGNPGKDDQFAMSMAGESMSLSLSKELIAHMEYSIERARFQSTKPQGAPFLPVECVILVEVHAKFGKDLTELVALPPRRRGKGLADTGAQVCTAGPTFLATFNIDVSFLVPTKMGVKGMTQAQVTILGALFVEISSSGRNTRQVVYIASEARSLILSEKALMDLGVIPHNFPTAGTFGDECSADVKVKSAVVKAKCGCELRTEVPPLPLTIPFDPIDTNLDKFEAWFTKVHYSSSAFNVCEHQLMPCITGPDLVIRHKGEQDPEPVAIHSPIPVAHHWKKAVKQGLDRDCNLGVIEPVPANVPTTWCSRMVVTPKKDGTPRRVVDLQALNKVSVRETHHTPSPWQQVSYIPKNMRKTVLDAKDGYHSVKLSPESKDKTTFITEWGRYRYCRAVQGYKASGDAYTKRYDDITVDVPDKTRCVDDTCLWKASIEELFWHTCHYIDLCARNGVIFNPRKFVFGREIVDFAGYTVTLDSIKPTDKMISAIKDFPAPTTLTQARGWFGLVNQVSYAFAQSEVMAPFRELLKKNTKFYWDAPLDELFAKSKKDIIDRVVNGVKMFDTIRTTCLATDWSKVGVGFVLLQKHCQCVGTEKAPRCGPDHWYLVFAGSRFLKDVETRYAPIEGEALAVVFALEQARMYVLGCNDLIVATDHKPLVPILNTKRLDAIKNPRMLNFKEKTLMYDFRAQHVPGVNFAPDATSRNPSGANANVLLSLLQTDSLLSQDDAQSLHEAIINSVTALDDEVISWARVKEAAQSDDMCMTLCDAIESGFRVKKSEAVECLRPYYKLKDELYAVDGVPFLDRRMFIPRSLRRGVLSFLHAAHQGTSGMKRVASARFWWLGMDADIDQVRSQCRHCNEMATSNVREPLLDCKEPEYPWQLIVMDYFDQEGKHFLVVADRYTGWPELFRQDSKAVTLVRTCRGLFAQFGIPEEIANDGGSPFTSYEWKQFLRQWDIYQRKSSANFPQSNGRAELAVKSCKRLLTNNTDSVGNLDSAKVTRALLAYRNTPIAGLGMSPAYMLYGRQLRDCLPSVPSYLQRYGEPSKVWIDIRQGRELAAARKQAKSVEQYDINKRPLAPLSVGDSVSIQNRRGTHPLRWDRTGKIVERLEHRQYLVKADGSGRVLLRNRMHLRKINPATSDRSAYDIDRPISKVHGDGDAPTNEHDTLDEPLLVPGQLHDGTEVIHPIEQHNQDNFGDGGGISGSNSDIPLHAEHPGPGLMGAPATLPTVEPMHLRRGTRIRKVTKVLTPVMHGKRHEEVPSSELDVDLDDLDV